MASRSYSVFRYNITAVRVTFFLGITKKMNRAAIVDIRLRGMDGNAFIREASPKNAKLAFIICAGSPEYDIPSDLLALTCVSNHLFRKPVNDMTEMEKEIQRQVTIIEQKQE